MVWWFVFSGYPSPFSRNYQPSIVKSLEPFCFSPASFFSSGHYLFYSIFLVFCYHLIFIGWFIVGRYHFLLIPQLLHLFQHWKSSNAAILKELDQSLQAFVERRAAFHSLDQRTNRNWSMFFHWWWSCIVLDRTCNFRPDETLLASIYPLLPGS